MHVIVWHAMLRSIRDVELNSQLSSRSFSFLETSLNFPYRVPEFSMFYEKVDANRGSFDFFKNSQRLVFAPTKMYFQEFTKKLCTSKK